MKIRVKKNNITTIIFLLSIIGPIGFFCLCTTFGIAYQSSEKSSIYLVYNTSLFILSMTLILYNIIKKNTKVRYSHIIVTFIFAFYFLSYFFGNYNNETSRQLILQFGLWCIPSAYIGLYFSQHLKWKSLFKYIDLLIIIMTYTAFNTALVFISKGWQSVTSAGLNYQDASYIAAFSYGLTLYIILFDCDYFRFNFFKSKIVNKLYIGFLIIQLLSLFICGGRGALILVIVYTFLLTIKNISIRTLIKYACVIVLIIVSIRMVAPLFGMNDQLEIGFARATSFINNGNVDWSNSSGRDVIYSSLIEGIKNNLLFGYGMFDYRSVFGLPHNLFLELLIQGGVLLLLVWGVFLIYLLKKNITFFKKYPEFGFMNILFLYSLVMLMFSGSYLNNSVFWFAIGILLGISNNKIDNSMRRLSS